MNDHDTTGPAMTDDGPAPDALTLEEGGAPADSSAPEGTDAAGAETEGLTVEDLLDMIDRLTSERDGHLEARARLQAEFDNYRKRVANQQTEQVERAAETLVGKLLPVLDACDAALAHKVEGVEPLAGQLSGVLEREGLQRLSAVDEPFDPALHEAVIHEPGDGSEPVVSEVLRSGYTWKGRVLRPAMVKVKG